MHIAIPELHFIGTRRSSPSQLLRLCVGPPTSEGDQTQGKVNISWDPLPCHLQNGNNVAGYIIRYTQLSMGAGVANTIVPNNKLICSQESGGPYSCLIAAESLFIPRMTYSFQVAARNGFGVGSFSNSVIAVYGSQGKHINSANFKMYYSLHYIMLLCLNDCMNLLLSETNCTISSDDEVTKADDKTTVISSSVTSDMIITTNQRPSTHDQENTTIKLVGPVTSKPAQAESAQIPETPDNTGLIAAVVVVIIVLSLLGIATTLVVVLLVRKR